MIYQWWYFIARIKLTTRDNSVRATKKTGQIISYLIRIPQIFVIKFILSKGLTHFIVIPLDNFPNFLFQNSIRRHYLQTIFIPFINLTKLSNLADKDKSVHHKTRQTVRRYEPFFNSHLRLLSQCSIWNTYSQLWWMTPLLARRQHCRVCANCAPACCILVVTPETFADICNKIHPVLTSSSHEKPFSKYALAGLELYCTVGNTNYRLLNWTLCSWLSEPCGGSEWMQTFIYRVGVASTSQGGTVRRSKSDNFDN